MPKNRLVGLVGRAGAGKDTLALALVQRHGFTRRAFADPLKAAVSAITGWPLVALENRDFKEREDPLWGVTPRRFMQHLGTEGMRSLKEDVWLCAFQSWLFHMAPYSPIVVTDVRFPNEVEFLRERGALLVLVSRPQVDNLPVLHASERMAWEWVTTKAWGTDPVPPGVLTVVNDSTVQELQAMATTVLECEHIVHDVPADVRASELKGH